METNTDGKMGNMQAQLADFLDNAAESLRKQSQSMTASESGPDFGGSLSAVAPQIASSEAAVAGVLAGSASWLRENDLSRFRSTPSARWPSQRRLDS
jgi:hypothetical protein